MFVWFTGLFEFIIDNLVVLNMLQQKFTVTPSMVPPRKDTDLLIAKGLFTWLNICT